MQSEWSDEELILSLKKLAERLKRVPTSRDVEIFAETPSRNAFERVFGTWNKTLEAAGFKPHQLKKSHTKYSQQTLTNYLVSLKQRLGRTPTVEDIQKNHLPSFDTYTQRFGSWPKALESAGLAVQRGYTREELLEQMEKIAKELGHFPNYKEIPLSKGYPSPMTFYNRFGSWKILREEFEKYLDRFNQREQIMDYMSRLYPNAVMSLEERFSTSDIYALMQSGYLSKRESMGRSIYALTGAGLKFLKDREKQFRV